MNPVATSYFFQLPEDIQIQICKHLSIQDISRFSLVCKESKKICLKDELWKLLFQTSFPEKYVNITLMLKSEEKNKRQKIDWLESYKLSHQTNTRIKMQEFSIKEVDISVPHLGDLSSLCELIVEKNHIINLMQYDDISIIDCRKGELKEQIKDEAPCSAKVHQGKLIYGCEDGSIKIRNFELPNDNPTILTTGEDSPVLFLDNFNNFIVVGKQKGRIEIFDLECSGVKFQAFNANSDSEVEEDNDLEILKIFDGKILLYFEDKNLKIYDLATFECLACKKLEIGLEFIEFVGERTLAIAQDGTLQEIDLKDAHVSTLVELGDICTSYFYEVMKNRLLIGRIDGFLEIWDTNEFKFKEWKAHEESVRYIEIFDEDKIVTYSLTTNESTIVKIWDLSTSSLLMEKEIKDQINKMKAHDLKIILSSDEKVYIWDFSNN